MITIQQLTNELAGEWCIYEDVIYAFIDQLIAIDGHNPVHNGDEISDANADHIRRSVAAAVKYGDL